jgi:hypothetical protein
LKEQERLFSGRAKSWKAVSDVDVHAPFLIQSTRIAFGQSKPETRLLLLLLLHNGGGATTTNCRDTTCLFLPVGPRGVSAKAREIFPQKKHRDHIFLLLSPRAL